MKFAFALVAAALLTGCGYVGDPLPPALNIPEKVTDLQAVQRGDLIHIGFTLPKITTEGLPIRRFEGIDLRIGAANPPFDHDRWASSARPITLEPTTLESTAARVEAVTSAREWFGRNATVAVRLIGSSGRPSDWSDPAIVNVLQPLPMPASVRAEPHPQGVRLSWTAPLREGQRFRITRKGETDKEPVVTATVEGGEYVDTSVALGKHYEYAVQAIAGTSESEISAPVPVVVRDTFAPQVPTGLTAVTALNSIELNWERGADSDTALYRVYRAEGDGEPALLADSVQSSAFSDKRVTAGKVYRYFVSSVDQAGNESAKTAPVQVVAP